MTPADFVQELASVRVPNVFNPYADTCPVHDRADAVQIRRNNLVTLLSSAQVLDTDTIWMGRDLGYRGGRRTGLALTDEAHLSQVSLVYPGTLVAKSTLGSVVVERTAAEIWAMLASLPLPPFLWNVFPFHPHEPDLPFTNRKFTVAELKLADALNRELLSWLRIRRVVAIGQDAAHYASQFGVKVECVRHPSYGGVMEFRDGIRRLYGTARLPLHRRSAQASLI